MSGNLVDAASLAERGPARKGLTFFQSHGSQDPILGFEGAQKLFEALNAAGWFGEFVEFKGGHAIPRPVFDGLTTYLDNLL